MTVKVSAEMLARASYPDADSKAMHTLCKAVVAARDTLEDAVFRWEQVVADDGALERASEVRAILDTLEAEP